MSIAYLKRYFSYTFWVALEVIAFVGLPHLVIFPVAAYLLGKEEFGLFIFSLGIVMMLGKSPSIGLATGVIRNMTAFQKPAKDLLVSSSIRLCKIAMLLIVLTGFVALGIARFFWQINVNIILCIVPLLILLYSWNVFELQMVRYRVERRFALRTMWYALLGMLLFISIPAAILGGAIGMAWGYMLGFVISRIILSWRQKILFKKAAYDPELGRLLKNTWFHLTLASMLEFSGRYIYRIILGIFRSYSEVSIFFGATNIIDLCLAPVAILSYLLFSMLSGFSCLEDVGKRQRYMVLAGGVLIALGAPLMLFLAGPFILSIMFPTFADESARILRLIIMIIPFTVTISFSRPFVLKFGPIKFLPVLNFITLMGHLVPSIMLVPKIGISGAVISCNIGYGLSAILWLAALVWTFKFGSKLGTAIEEPQAVDLE